MSKTKPFSPDLYKEYDGPAVAAVLEYLDGLGVYARSGADKYGVDIVTFGSGSLRSVAYIEVEVAATWTSGPWPYPDCHVLGRKMKFLGGGLGLPCTLYRLRKDLGRAILVQDHVLSPEMLQSVPNRYIPEGEDMLVVPIDLCEEVQLFEFPSSSSDSREVDVSDSELETPTSIRGGGS